MRSFIKNSTISACFALLSLSLLCQPAFCRDDGKVSYLDGVSSSYLYNQSSDSGNGIEATFKLDTKPIITNSNKKVTMSLRDSDIQQALRMLADKAGINIIFDKSVEGKITLDLHDIDVNDAFLVIFKSRQLTYTMDANTLTVMTNDAYKETGYSRQNMTVLPIKYVSADSVAQFLNKNLFKSGITGLSNKPIVTSNPGTNQIVVFGSNADVMAIKRILPVLDVKPLINNFKVNHTTPKEMAQLICDSLFYKSGEEDGKKSSEKIDLEGDEVRLGGGVLVCRDSSNTQQSSDEDNLSAFRANPLSVSYFSELGQIGVYGGSQEQVNLIRDFIKMHDKKQLMAYIELSVIELNETGSKEFSNEWNLWTPFISLGFTPGGGLQTASTPFFVWGHEYPTNAEGSAFVRKVSNNNAL
ncbi:hypothetical protein IJ670_05920, partial [bacterium]|nr:hypothetical protein [bacterium]